MAHAAHPEPGRGPGRGSDPPSPVKEAAPATDADAWLAAAVHDLREPLHTAASYLQLLGDRAALDDDARRCLEGAGRAVDDCLALVQDTLAWARAGHVEPEPVAVADALARACARTGHLLEGISLEVAALPTVRADAQVLVRVLQNLLGNAVRHGGAGVHVRVGARRSGRGWWVDVDDDGPGLPPGVDVFEPFRRGPGSSGTGLGLAFVRRVALAHGGRVAAGASPLGGARVSVWLPAARAARPQRP